MRCQIEVGLVTQNSGYIIGYNYITSTTCTTTTTCANTDALNITTTFALSLWLGL